MRKNQRINNFHSFVENRETFDTNHHNSDSDEAQYMALLRNQGHILCISLPLSHPLNEGNSFVSIATVIGAGIAKSEFLRARTALSRRDTNVWSLVSDAGCF
eukprot:Selendium_serpulae@DN5678_c0_g1_i1.p1